MRTSDRGRSCRTSRRRASAHAAAFVAFAASAASSREVSALLRLPSAVRTVPRQHRLDYYSSYVVGAVGGRQPTLLQQKASDDRAESKPLVVGDNVRTVPDYSEALRRQQEQSVQEFAEQKAPEWIRKLLKTDPEALIPFSCTGCGKCCQTIGSVYMSPDDVRRASSYLNLSPQQFIKKYVSHVLVSDNDTSTMQATANIAATPWVRLRDSEPTSRTAAAALASTESLSSCVFLDSKSNHCSIYEARPTQCRTYPFWPSIVASVSAWNEECRRSDDDDGRQYDVAKSILPVWTPSNGGCEGMAPVSDSHPENLLNGSATLLRDAVLSLHMYEQDHRRFPHTAKELQVPNHHGTGAGGDGLGGTFGDGVSKVGAGTGQSLALAIALERIFPGGPF